MIPQNFTTKSQEIIQNAARIAYENGQPQIEPPHLFFALLEDTDGVVVSVLHKFNANTIALKAGAQSLIDKLPKQPGAMPSGGIGQILLSQGMIYIFQTAVGEAKKMGDEYISVEHLFLSFLVGHNPI